MRNWLLLALSRRVIQRALIMALLVAPVLILINQGDYIFGQDSNRFSWAKAILTFLVPYTVSTISSVNALRQCEGPKNAP